MWLTLAPACALRARHAGTRQERAHKSLIEIGGAVWNGGITTFLAVVPMAVAEHYIFTTIFEVSQLPAENIESSELLTDPWLTHIARTTSPPAHSPDAHRPRHLSTRRCGASWWPWLCGTASLCCP